MTDEPWLVGGHHYSCAIVQGRGGVCTCRGPAASERLPLPVLLERLETVASEARYFQQNGMWVNLDRTHAELLEQAAWYLRAMVPTPNPDSGPALESGPLEIAPPDDEDIVDAEIVED